MESKESTSTSVIDEFKVGRVSLFKEEYLLIIFLILLFIELNNYVISRSSSDNSIIGNSIEYLILFLALVCLYFPKKITFNQKFIFIVAAIIFRLRVLFYLPILSSDLHRNLLFGSVFASGWNPYLWTIQELPQLFQHGFISKVSYTSEWASHSFDYPSLAIMFFAFITYLVPADNYSAYVLAKLILMVFDALNAYLIYRILKDHFKLNEVSKKVGLLYLINPISVFWINVEGQFESVPLFFILLSIYLLFLIPANNKLHLDEPYNFFIRKEYLPYIIGFTLGCGVLLKYFPLIFAIPIIFYFGKRWSYIINFLFSLFSTIIFLSIPFLVNSYYITNFLFFQIVRKGNTVNDTNYNIGFGINVPAFTLLIILIGLIFIYSLYKKLDKKIQTSILGLFSIYVFIYINNSIFSWYVLWLFGTLLFINTNYDEFYRSLLWVISLVLLIFILQPSYFFLVIQIIFFSYILTLKSFRLSIKKYLQSLNFLQNKRLKKSSTSNKT